MNPDNFLRPNKGITSVEAAALYLSEGRTSDPELAVAITQQSPAIPDFSFDGLQRSGIARSMGFDFDVTIDYTRKRFICVNKLSGYKTTAYYTEMDEKAIKRLVRALGRLKKQHDSLQAKH